MKYMILVHSFDRIFFIIKKDTEKLEHFRNDYIDHISREPLLCTMINKGLEDCLQIRKDRESKMI
jgi:hypothetical protein